MLSHDHRCLAAALLLMQISINVRITSTAEKYLNEVSIFSLKEDDVYSVIVCVGVMLAHSQESSSIA